jgi:hypothetical protein
MAGAQAELGLKIAFYCYPCLLFVVLLGTQSLQFYRSRRRAKRAESSGAKSNKNAEDTEVIPRIHARLIWTLQLVLSCLLLTSIIFAVREVLAGHDGFGTVAFPLSAYVVCVSRPTPPYVRSLTFPRPHTSAFSCISLLAYFLIRKGHGHQAPHIASRGSRRLWPRLS